MRPRADTKSLHGSNRYALTTRDTPPSTAGWPPYRIDGAHQHIADLSADAVTQLTRSVSFKNQKQIGALEAGVYGRSGQISVLSI